MMNRSARVLAVSLALIGSAAAEPIELESPGDGVKLAGTVLVWADAKLYLDANDTGPSIVLGMIGARPAALGQVVPMHVVSARGAFVEVEPTPDVQCAWVRIAPVEDLTKLRLFVKRTDLAPLVTRRFDAKLADGTRMTLEVGAPVGKRAAGGYLVPFLSDALIATLPATSIGFGYPPRAIAPIRAYRAKDWTLATGEVQLDGQPVTIRGSWTSPTAQVRKDTVLFPLRARCMTAIVAAPKDRATRDAMMGAEGGSGVGGLAGMGTGLIMPKGLALTAPGGGHTVAVTARPIFIGSAPAKATEVCIARPVGVYQPVADAPAVKATEPPARTLELCAPIDKLVDTSPPGRY